MNILKIKYFFWISMLFCYCKNYDTKDIKQNKKKYTKLLTSDSNLVLNKLKVLLANKEDLFYNSGYSGQTTIIIDSIIYNKDSSKMAVFAIIKSPISNLQILNRKDKSEWFYDATCYVGLRQIDTIIIKWVGHNLVSFFDYQEISNAIRNECLYNFSSIDSTNHLYSEYNMHDSLFWTSPFWNKVIPHK